MAPYDFLELKGRVSRLTDLIARAKARDSALGEELEREFKALASRRAFGLNFERHRPESVELPGRPVRRGDKVRILPPRGSTQRGDQRLWRVTQLEAEGGAETAYISLIGGEQPESSQAPVADLVVVAEFRDYIFPGLVSTGRVERGSEKPFHTVINGENFHVLEALTYTHRGRIDAIYIDPPYNSGASDWKYNNDYVAPDDLYRHSKWLAMMERRLKVARKLLKPSRSVLIVTIDEKEVHRVALLLEQIFDDASIQMVTSIISAKGAVRVGKFSRVEEHLFFVAIGDAAAKPWFRNMLDPTRSDVDELRPIEWLGLRRREPSSVRGARPNQFYPIYVHARTGHIHSVGAPIDDGVVRDTVPIPDGTIALWPLKPDGTEMLWGLTPEVLRRNITRGYVRVNRWSAAERRGTVQYLPGGTIDQIREGAIIITGTKPDGSVIGVVAVDDDASPPKRVWNVSSHNAETGGTNILSSLIPGRRFPYPKSLYAVEDALRFYLADNLEAVVLDFFSGSGTTAHAVMRLNRQDGGRRQCILATNNEVANEEQASLRNAGFRPGDPDWERWGICDFITKPRIASSITGKTPDGENVVGSYRFTDEFPLAEGFAENAEFFTLTYEAPIAVSHNLAFQRIAPLLWMRAGSEGRRINELPTAGWDFADVYGLLVDLDHAAAFCEAAAAHPSLRVAYIVTNGHLENC